MINIKRTGNQTEFRDSRHAYLLHPSKNEEHLCALSHSTHTHSNKKRNKNKLYSTASSMNIKTYDFPPENWRKQRRQHHITMSDEAWLASNITWIVLGGGDNYEPPMNRVITYLGFLCPGDFMVCTREDLNSVGLIILT